MEQDEQAGVRACETATEQGEKSQHSHQHHHHLLLQTNTGPGGGRALGFGLSGLGLVLFIFWLLKTHQSILYGIPDSFQLCWPSRALPFLGPGLNTSIPNASSFPTLWFDSYFYPSSYYFIIILPFSWYRTTIPSKPLEPQRRQPSLSSGKAEPLEMFLLSVCWGSD